MTHSLETYLKQVLSLSLILSQVKKWIFYSTDVTDRNRKNKPFLRYNIISPKLSLLHTHTHTHTQVESKSLNVSTCFIFTVSVFDSNIHLQMTFKPFLEIISFRFQKKELLENYRHVC